MAKVFGLLENEDGSVVLLVLFVAAGWAGQLGAVHGDRQP